MQIDFHKPILKAILGPTNTGKTHYAIDRMLAHQSGVIGLPLRLLAREVYDRIVKIKGAKQCALITGEEKIIPSQARYYICTVEAMPTEKKFSFLAVDEIQLINDLERGHIFTDRILNARGTQETLFLGAQTVRSILKSLIPKISFDYRERFSDLNYSGPAKLMRLPKRSVIVAFSSAEVYSIAELIRTYRGGAAVVMGGLSPRTRNSQAELFQNGEVDFLVATDAVGMGLNLDTDHVAFAALSKYDGRRRRYLYPMEAAQIAGRAGRFRNNGTFGTTGNCLPMDEELIKKIETHNFDQIRKAEWRNSQLNFSSIEALTESLHLKKPHNQLHRIIGASDENAYEKLISIPEIAQGIKVPAQVKQLWDICQVPDFRNLTIDTHIKLLQDLYRLLHNNGGKIPEVFIEKKIKQLDDTLGNVALLSSRLANIRTWSYCVNKVSWMQNKNNLANYTRAVEDRLSDALHEALIARFVDKRTNKLLKSIGSKDYMKATIKDNGDVQVDDQIIGQLNGLKFTPSKTSSALEAETIRATAEKIVTPEINRRMTSLCGGVHTIFTLSTTGSILWGGKIVGQIDPSGTPLNPNVEIICGDFGDKELKRLSKNRMHDFLKAEALNYLKPLYDLKEIYNDQGASAEARGLAYIMFENLGVINRKDYSNKLKKIDQVSRKKLRDVNVHFGQYNVYIRDLMKPKPANLLSILTAYGTGGDKNPFLPFAGVTSIPRDKKFIDKHYSNLAIAIAGYRVVGPRIVRLDILNRLSDQIRQAQQQCDISGDGKKFQIMQEMLAIMGCTYLELQGVLRSLGFHSKVIETDQIDTKNTDIELIESKPKDLSYLEKSEVIGDKEILSEPKNTSLNNNKTLNIYHHRTPNEDGIIEEVVNTEYWFVNKGKYKNNNTARNNFKNKKQKTVKKNTPGNQRNTSPHNKKDTTSKNSPFAMLAELKRNSEG